MGSRVNDVLTAKLDSDAYLDEQGGLLDQPVALADMFMDHGQIVSTRGRNPDSDQSLGSQHRGTVAAHAQQFNRRPLSRHLLACRIQSAAPSGRTRTAD